MKLMFGPKALGVPPVGKSPGLNEIEPFLTWVTPPVKLLANVLLIADGATPGPTKMSKKDIETGIAGQFPPELRRKAIPVRFVLTNDVNCEAAICS